MDLRIRHPRLQDLREVARTRKNAPTKPIIDPTTTVPIAPNINASRITKPLICLRVAPIARKIPTAYDAPQPPFESVEDGEDSDH